METIFINTSNGKTSESNRFRYFLTDKVNLKKRNKTVAPANMSVYYIWKNVKSKYKNNKFKITAPTWDKTFDLPDGSYNIQQKQDCFEFIIKQLEAITDENFPTRIYENKTKNRIVFKIKASYKLELLTNETIKLLGDGPIITNTKTVLIYHNFRLLQLF